MKKEVKNNPNQKKQKMIPASLIFQLIFIISILIASFILVWMILKSYEGKDNETKEIEIYKNVTISLKKEGCKIIKENHYLAGTEGITVLGCALGEIRELNIEEVNKIFGDYGIVINMSR